MEERAGKDGQPVDPDAATTRGRKEQPPEGRRKKSRTRSKNQRKSQSHSDHVAAASSGSGNDKGEPSGGEHPNPASKGGVENCDPGMMMASPGTQLPRALSMKDAEARAFVPAGQTLVEPQTPARHDPDPTSTSTCATDQRPAPEPKICRAAARAGMKQAEHDRQSAAAAAAHLQQQQGQMTEEQYAAYIQQSQMSAYQQRGTPSRQHMYQNVHPTTPPSQQTYQYHAQQHQYYHNAQRHYPSTQHPSGQNQHPSGQHPSGQHPSGYPSGHPSGQHQHHAHSQQAYQAHSRQQGPATDQQHMQYTSDQRQHQQGPFSASSTRNVQFDDVQHLTNNVGAEIQRHEDRTNQVLQQMIQQITNLRAQLNTQEQQNSTLKQRLEGNETTNKLLETLIQHQTRPERIYIPPSDSPKAISISDQLFTTATPSKPPTLPSGLIHLSVGARSDAFARWIRDARAYLCSSAVFGDQIASAVMLVVDSLYDRWLTSTTQQRARMSGYQITFADIYAQLPHARKPSPPYDDGSPSEEAPQA